MIPIIICVILFPMLSHPLRMGLTLLLLVLLLAFNLVSLYSYIWLSYILVLILLGGLLVIFIYIALVATNETFSIFKASIPALGLFFITTGILLIWDNLHSIKERQQSFISWNMKGLEFPNFVRSFVFNKSKYKWINSDWQHC